MFSRSLLRSIRFVRPAALRNQQRILYPVRFYSDKPAQIKVDKPELMLAFKCKKCDTRSSHIISKQAYTGGTVLVTCPGCKNRHLIADHLKVSETNSIDIYRYGYGYTNNIDLFRRQNNNPRYIKRERRISFSKHR